MKTRTALSLHRKFPPNCPPKRNRQSKKRVRMICDTDTVKDDATAEDVNVIHYYGTYNVALP